MKLKQKLLNIRRYNMVRHEEVVETVEVKKTKYSYYCDECGEYIGSQVASPEESITELGIYEKNIFVGNKKFRIKRNLCSKCEGKANEKLGKVLDSIGYEVM